MQPMTVTKKGRKLIGKTRDHKKLMKETTVWKVPKTSQ